MKRLLSILDFLPISFVLMASDGSGSPMLWSTFLAIITFIIGIIVIILGSVRDKDDFSSPDGRDNWMTAGLGFILFGLMCLVITCIQHHV